MARKSAKVELPESFDVEAAVEAAGESASLPETVELTPEIKAVAARNRAIAECLRGHGVTQMAEPGTPEAANIDRILKNHGFIQ